MSKSKTPSLSQEIIDGIRTGDLPNGTGLNLRRYVKADENGNFVYGIVYIEEWNDEETSCCLRGAYYGYTGGGEHDGGFFYIDIENDIHTTLDFSEAEEDEHSDLYNALMYECGRFYEEDDGVYSLNEYSTGLIEVGSQEDDGALFVDDEFDTDTLEQVSNQWVIGLRFES